MKGSIVTVKGEIQGEQLGFCHSHEHLFLADGQSAKINKALRIDDYDKTLEEVLHYQKIGGQSIVDAQPVGCGRMADFLHKVSERANVSIVASTGFHKMIFYPEDHWIRQMSEEELSELFISELQSGMYINSDTKLDERIKARAGIIKTAVDVDGMTIEYQKLFAAAARASIQTGAPIMSHSETRTGLEQIKFLNERGIASDYLIICHIDRSITDMAYQLEVAKTGVYMELDTIGRFKYHSDEQEAELIVKLIEAGYEDKILLGLDVTRERLKSYGGEIGLEYITKSFIPLMKKHGITDTMIHKFMVTNPSKAFARRK